MFIPGIVAKARRLGNASNLWYTHEYFQIRETNETNSISAPRSIAMTTDGNVILLSDETGSGLVGFAMQEDYKIGLGGDRALVFAYGANGGTDVNGVCALSNSTGHIYLTATNPNGKITHWNSSSYQNTITVTDAVDVKVNATGTKMIVLTATGLSSYTLGTAFDVSTATSDSISFDLSSYDTGCKAFACDGDVLLVLGDTTNTLYEFSFGTAWNLSTLSYTNVYTDLATTLGPTSWAGVSMSVDQSEVFVSSGGSSADVYRLLRNESPADYFSVTDNTDDENISGSILSITNSADNVKDFTFKPDGTKLYFLDDNLDSIRQVDLSTAWDLNTMSDPSKSAALSTLSGISGSWFSFTFKPDGTKVYAMLSFVVYEFSLSTAWDISTASYSSVGFNTGLTINPPNGVRFKPDGTKMFVTRRQSGSTTDFVEYALSSAWDITTASQTDITNHSQAENAHMMNRAFEYDGTNLFIFGKDDYEKKAIVHYVTSSWDISTATRTTYGTGPITPQSASVVKPGGMYWRSDANKMYVMYYYTSGGTPVGWYIYSLNVEIDTTAATIPYSPEAVNFDGTNDYLNRVSTLTGATDNKYITFSCWVKPGINSDNRILYRTGSDGTQANARMYFQRASDNKFWVDVKNGSNTYILQFNTSAAVFTTDTGWHHIMFSIDMNSTSTRHVYVDGVLDSSVTWTTYTNDSIDHTTASNYIGWWGSTGRRWHGDVAEFYYTNEYIDLSSPTNRQKFISSTKYPVSLGSNGSTPTGTQPLIYYKGTASTWNAGSNAGSGGSFVMSGTVTDSTNEPVKL